MDNSDDDIFDFDSPDFIEVENEKEKIISNEHHFNLITEISNNFYTTLEKNDIFEHKETWVKSSILEPIKLNCPYTYCNFGILVALEFAKLASPLIDETFANRSFSLIPKSFNVKLPN